MIASRYGNKDVCKKLLATKEIDVDLQDKIERNAMCHARDYSDIVFMILDKRASDSSHECIIS